MTKHNILKSQLMEIVNKFDLAKSGVVSITDLPLDQQENIKRILPTAKSIISIAVKYNQSAVKSQHQPIANIEYRNAYKNRDSVCSDIVNSLIENDIESVAVTETFAFDNELKTPWLISHKDIALKAGVGVMGLNRIVLHEKYGASIVLGSILIDKELDVYDTEAVYDPCINCNLCKAVCPTASISNDGFDMMGCYTHNYRNRGNSFYDLLSRNEKGSKGLDNITFEQKNNLWSSIQEGYGYSCNKCIAVCPAAKSEKIKYVSDKKEYYKTYVKPLIDKVEAIYVIKGSRSALHLEKNSIKKVKYISNGMTIDSIKAFKSGLRIVFNEELAKNMNRSYRFVFTGIEVDSFVVNIEDGKLSIVDEPTQNFDLSVVVDSKLWLEFLKSKKVLLKGLITGKMKIKGSPKLLIEFGSIFTT